MSRENLISILNDHKVELYNQGVKSLAVFGSVARGDNSPQSDVDILVEFDHPVGLFEFIRLKHFLELMVGCEVDLVTLDALRPMMRERIMKEAIYVR